MSEKKNTGRMQSLNFYSKLQSPNLWDTKNTQGQPNLTYSEQHRISNLKPLRNSRYKSMTVKTQTTCTRAKQHESRSRQNTHLKQCIIIIQKTRHQSHITHYTETRLE